MCQVVEEEITALISLEPGKSFEPLASLSSSLGIPLLALDSSGAIERILSGPQTVPGSLSSLINLAPQPRTVGRALSEVITANPSTAPLVFFYRDVEELMWLEHFGPELMRNGVILTEIKTGQRLSEQLALGACFILDPIQSKIS